MLAFFRLNKIVMYLIGAIKAGSHPLMPKSTPPHIKKPLFISGFFTFKQKYSKLTAGFKSLHLKKMK
ncbi:hypothetical protein CIK00_14270 [Photobacterium carnosum]|jgi:hypothetical protein|uniref:Uncharacterized protein n=1 Tax=Photobacterium carnosum TaxID=2023717 RepID=A0A2N4UQI8_9GAMM|nr:hypothetical protein CIK00_14270 [Photobacterium carnosum]